MDVRPGPRLPTAGVHAAFAVGTGPVPASTQTHSAEGEAVNRDIIPNPHFPARKSTRCYLAASQVPQWEEIIPRDLPPGTAMSVRWTEQHCFVIELAPVEKASANPKVNTDDLDSKSLPQLQTVAAKVGVPYGQTHNAMDLRAMIRQARAAKKKDKP